MRDTFRELAQAVFTPESVTHVEQVVDRCEQLATVRELTALLRRCGRS